MLNTRKILSEIGRVILGGTFVFSGFTKSVDPYGTAYKVADYLKAFNLSELSFLEMPLSFVLCGFELALGIALLLGIYRKWSSWLMLLTMCFMTPLTLYLAIANPVSDCGCFGDALVISNWETFYKNVVLILIAIYLAFNHQYISPLFNNRAQKYALVYLVTFSSLFLFFNYYFDPIIDFRPYKTGVNLAKQMELTPEMMPIEENTYTYEKDGVQKEFSEDNYPWEDSTWVFVSMESKVIKEGSLPPISDFAIGQLVFDDENKQIIEQYDITEDVINNTNYTFIIIAPFLKDISSADKEKLEAIINYSEVNKYQTIMLTASSTDEIIDVRNNYSQHLTIGITDEKVLKTIVRANPSLILLQDGNILAKWANPSIPDDWQKDKSIEQIVKDSNSGIGTWAKIFIVFLSFIFPLLIIKYIHRNK